MKLCFLRIAVTTQAALFTRVRCSLYDLSGARQARGHPWDVTPAAARLRARRRLAGDPASPATETPDGFRAGDGGLAPEPLPFNTRVHCAVCSQPAHTADGKQTFECATCRNVTYCCPDHRDLDRKRHGFWCGRA